MRRRDAITLLVSASIIGLLAWFGASQVDAHHKPTHTGGTKPSSSPSPTISPAASRSPTASPQPSVSRPPASATPTVAPSVMPTPSTGTSTPSPSATPTTPTATPGPSATVHVEAQAWWSTDGIDVPTTVGHHIHVEALNFPAPGVIVDGVYPLRVRVTLHRQEGQTSWYRVSDGNTTFPLVPFVLGPCHDCSTELTIPIDFGAFQTGVREVRLSVNVPDEQPAASGSQRMFNSTGWPVCVRSCAITDRAQGLAFVEARGWYLDHGYQNARADKASVKACQVIDIDLQPGSGGLPTMRHGVYVNPNMHAGDAGRVLLEGSGEYHGPITVPCDLVPGDKVALSAHDGNNGVVNVLRVVP